MNMQSQLKCMVSAVIAVAAPVAAPALTAATYQLSFFSAVLDRGAGTYAGPGYSATLTNAPSLTLDVTGTTAIDLSPYQTQYRAEIFYWAEVVGPTNATVPVDITYSETDTTVIQPNGYSIAQSRFDFYGTDVDDSVFGRNSGSQTVAGTEMITVTANTPFYIGMSAVDTMGGVGDTASISMDPMISIDPSFGLTGYTLDFSPGIQNIGPASPIPEPAAWSLMILGVGATGAVLRRRRNLARA